MDRKVRMMAVSRMVRVALVAGMSLCGLAAARAQAPTTEQLLHPSADSWPGYHGDYTAKRHSKLTQISPANVDKLTLAWAFQTNMATTIKSSPLLVDGILYFSVPDNVWAVDALTGAKVWEFSRPAQGDHVGNRGVAYYKDRIYFGTVDAHVI